MHYDHVVYQTTLFRSYLIFSEYFMLIYLFNWTELYRSISLQKYICQSILACGAQLKSGLFSGLVLNSSSTLVAFGMMPLVNWNRLMLMSRDAQFFNLWCQTKLIRTNNVLRLCSSFTSLERYVVLFSKLDNKWYRNLSFFRCLLEKILHMGFQMKMYQRMTS